MYHTYDSFPDLLNLVDQGVLRERGDDSVTRGKDKNNQVRDRLKIRCFSLPRSITNNICPKPAVVRKYDVDETGEFIRVEINIPRYYGASGNLEEDWCSFRTYPEEYSAAAIEMMSGDYVNPTNRKLVSDREFRAKYRLQGKRGDEVLELIKNLNRDKIKTACDDEMPKIWLVRHKYLKKTMTFCFACHDIRSEVGWQIRQDLFHVSTNANIAEMVREVKEHIKFPDMVTDICINFSEKLYDCVKAEFPRALICFDVSQIAIKFEDFIKASGNRHLSQHLAETSRDLVGAVWESERDHRAALKEFRSIIEQETPALLQSYPKETACADMFEKFMTRIERLAKRNGQNLYRQFEIRYFRTALSFSLYDYMDEVKTSGRPYSADRIIFHMMFLQDHLSKRTGYTERTPVLKGMPESMLTTETALSMFNDHKNDGTDGRMTGAAPSKLAKFCPLLDYLETEQDTWDEGDLWDE